MALRVFISYGRGDAAALAERLARDLAGRGLSVWLDVRRLRGGHAWDGEVEAALRDADRVLALLSPHAVRRGDPAVPGGEHDSVCLDELALARFSRPPKPIVPVMAIDCELPLVLARSTWIDGRAWAHDEEAYAAGLDRLADALAAGGPGEVRGEAGALWDFAAWLAEKRRGFAGRNWLFAELDAWLASGSGPAAVILGEPGVGKSAFIAELAHRNPRGLVLAVHCCQADTAATLEPLRFVAHLAASLALTLPAYAGVLARRGVRLPSPAAGADADEDPGSLFEAVVLGPLSACGPPPGGIGLIIVDSLDEALGRRPGPTILDVLGPRLDRLPPWLRLIATSRPDRAVLDKLGSITAIALDARDPRNAEDLDRFVAGALGRIAPAGGDPGAAAALAARSAGNFLFAREALKGVERGLIPLAHLADLPQGLAGLYERAFERLFPDEGRYAAPRRVLECLLAAREPLGEPDIAAMTGLAPRQVRAAVDALGSYLADADGQLAPYHRSLAEWLGDPRAGSRRYAADAAAGRARILRHCAGWREAGDAYALAHAPAHLAEAGQTEALDRLLTATDFAAVKAARLADRFAPLADFRLLGQALLEAGRLDRLASLLGAGEAVAREGLAGALASAGHAHDAGIDRVLAMLLARPGEGGRLAAIRIAAARGRADILLATARGGSPALRVRLVPQLHRLWLDDRDAGWRLMDRVIAGLFTIGGWPRLSQVEPLMGWMLAIVASHPDDARTLLALQHRLRALAVGCRESLAFRVLGRRWAIAPLLGALRLVMARQPDYQPFNLKEIQASMARPPALRRRAAPLRACLEDPGLDPAGAIAVLTDPDTPFDVHVMLLAERALVAASGRRPEATLALLERLWREGRPWLRQSLLYVGFHLIDKAPGPVAADWPDRYAAMALQAIAAARGTFATDLGIYSMEPHMAWLELVHQRRQPGAGARFLPGLLEEAHRLGDPAFAGRVIGAAQILGLAYGRPALALEVLLSAPALRAGPHHGRLVEALANLRLHAERTVDRALDRLAGSAAGVAAQVRAAAPTVGAADFPTFLDELATRLLLTDQRFRGELAAAFGRAEDAGSASELLRQVLPWAVDLAAGQAILSAPAGGHGRAVS